MKILAAVTGAAGLGLVKLLSKTLPGGIAQALDKYIYLPFVSNAETPSPTITPTQTATATGPPTQTPTPTSTVTGTPTDTPTGSATPTDTTTPTPTGSPTPLATPGDTPRVVHVHSVNSTYWDFGDTYYGDYVDQDTVDAMVDRGVMELTVAPSLAQAWQTLVPNYIPGKAIAIKVNFNNGRTWCSRCRTNCADWMLKIDALIHPINAIIHGLLQAYPNFDTHDIWVYDASQGPDPTRQQLKIPDAFTDGCTYTGVRFFDGGDCNEPAGYSSIDPTASITWHNPQGIPTPPAAQVTDVLVYASYIINIPIMKGHLGTKVTLSFKNHFGSLANVGPLHDWVYLLPNYGGTTYNPLVDIYRNPHILGKTVLTIGDGLFGNWRDNVKKPLPWSTFGNDSPNSLLFATDPVAIDCVMCDLIHTEQSVSYWADDYLVYAASTGLGTYERGDPWGSGYNLIDYKKIEI